MIDLRVTTTKAQRAPKQRIVLFDFDGVIVRGDAFTQFMRNRYARAWWRVLILLPLLPLLALLALPWRGRRRLLHAAVIWAFVGVGTGRYRELAQVFGRALARDARNIFAPACTALNMHRHNGDRVLVVTGCEEILARAILDELGFADVELVASRFAPGRFGMRIVVHNIRVEKARQLALRGIRPPWDVVYSDSMHDLPILAAARSAVLVNPDRITLARVSACLGRRLSLVEWR
ncbi:MAG: haloacid dehalogenase-like hydrolase [Dokdonella sp.]